MNSSLYAPHSALSVQQASEIFDKPEERYLFDRIGHTDYSALDTNLKLIQDMLKVPGQNSL